MRYSQLRAFDAVARHKTFSKAAQALNVTQPAVTVQVRALEEAYGLALFRRTSTAVIMTAAGRSLFELTRQMFAVETRIREELTAQEKLQSGTLSVAADGPHVLLKLIQQFQKSHPGVEVTVTLGNRATTLQRVLEHEVDLAIVANPDPDERLLVQPAALQDLVVLFPQGHPMAEKPAVTLEDLQGMKAVLREPGSHTYDTVKKALKKGRVKLSSELELNSREAIREAVATGLGIGFLFSEEAVGDNRCVARTLVGFERSSKDSLICLNNRASEKAIAGFCATVKAYYDSIHSR
ncbi:LysR substrate-binding domain-containing protein [Rhodovibrionaceae bacterium A322]